MGGVICTVLEPSGQESGNHGVPRAHGIAHRTRRDAQAAADAGFIQQHGPVPGHGDQHVPRSPLLQLLGARTDFSVTGRRPSENPAQLEDVGFDEEGPIGQRCAQQIPGGVYRRQDTLALQPPEDLLVDIVRQGVRDGPRQHQRVPCRQPVQLPEQLPHRRVRNGGTSSVDLALLLRLDLHVDAGQPLLQPDEICPQSGGAQALVQGPPGKSRQKTEGGILDAQIVQHSGNVDSLPAELDCFIRRPVQPAGLEILYPHHVIQSRIKGDSIDHRLHLLHFRIVQISLIRQMVRNHAGHFQWKRNSGGNLTELAGVGQDIDLLCAGGGQILGGG